MLDSVGLPEAKLITLSKVRTGERQVEIALDPGSDTTVDEIAGCDVVLFDDMVRTGSTVVQSCRFLQEANPRRIVFAVTHFYASGEGREKMADDSIDEILTLNTLPTVLNRDIQGRLRKKMVVLKIEPWLARNLCDILGLATPESPSLYQIDMSSKNPRFRRKIWSNDQLPGLEHY
jgi:ribose-phosphate pyrophosphokinase